MDVIRGDGQLLADINLDPPNMHQAVLQNIAIILDSIQGSAPMLRGLGISSEYYGRPLNVIENEIVANVYDQIEKYEPRAIIASVSIETNHITGQLIPIVELEGVKEDGE